MAPNSSLLAQGQSTSAAVAAVDNPFAMAAAAVGEDNGGLVVDVANNPVACKKKPTRNE